MNYPKDLEPLPDPFVNPSIEPIYATPISVEPTIRDSHGKIIWITIVSWLIPFFLMVWVSLGLGDAMIKSGYSQDIAENFSYIIGGIISTLYVIFRYNKILGIDALYPSIKPNIMTFTIIIPTAIIMVLDLVGSIGIGIITDFLFPNQLEIPLAYDDKSLTDPIFLILVYISLAIIAPISEELIFRGLILDYLRKNYGDWPSIVISAILFGLLHFLPSYIAVATYGGLIYGWLRIKTGSLLPSILCHALWNSFVFVVLYLL